VNPSREVTLAFQKECATLILPVSYGRSWKMLQARLEEQDYDFILMLGQASGRKWINLERVAINLQDVETPDEDGDQRLQKKIAENGADAFLSPLPLRAWAQMLQKMELPVEISFSAGAFVCNSIYYHMFQYLKTERPELHTNILFMHLPYLPEQVMGKAEATPSLSLEVMKKTTQALLRLL
jgi:pyroglutamyl-peptidase